MWPDLLRKAKEGGLNLIQTYVFWNIHEPVQGQVSILSITLSCMMILHFKTVDLGHCFLLVQFNYEGNYDLLKYIKMIGESGLWVNLRIGPYIEAEWNMGYLLFIVLLKLIFLSDFLFVRCLSVFVPFSTEDFHTG